MRKMVVICVCLLFVVSVLATSAVVLGKGKPPKPPEEEEKLAEGTEYRITGEPYGMRQSPTIFGEKIVWSDRKSSPVDESKLYVYELPDGPPEVIVEWPHNMYYPEIYENKIVFKSQPLGGDTYLYDLDGDGPPVLVKADHNARSDIYENRIVYVIKGDVWMYDLGEDEIPTSDDLEYQLTGGEDTSASSPRIFGNIIVSSEDYRTTEEWDPDIVIYYLGIDGIPGTGDDTRTILERPGRQFVPAINGNIIVWQDDRSTPGAKQKTSYKQRNYDIYMYDLGPDGIPGTGDDGEGEYQITTGRTKELSPDIYGNIVVWMDYRNDNCDIYMYDLTDKTEYRVPTNGADEAYQGCPRVFGNNIVYLDDRNGYYDIYMFTLT